MVRRTAFSYIALSAFVVFFTSCTESEVVSEEGDEIEIHVPEGFELEELFHPSEYEMGNWVALAEAPGDRIYAADQFGGMYYFEKPAIGETLDSTDIDSVAMDIGHVHGMLWHEDALYVAVNRQWQDTIETGSGVYRLSDQNGDGDLDTKEMLMKLEGAGEHGPHSFKVDPEGTLYFIAGNSTLIPENVVEKSLVPNHWADDNLLTPYPDARGHATEIDPPGGWVARMTEEGDWQLYSTGYRNPFDLAFNREGELFVFDSDMEWDFGMPWYRPIRICHATSASEFGWRRGTGKWPKYYPDALPPVVELGQGSPTGLLFGDALKFPQKYQNGLFAADWSFGTMYFVSLEEDGSTYKGSLEQFLYGVPLPIADVIAGSEGHMYFTIGGRRLDSRVYRLRYVGDENTDPASSGGNAASDSLRALRHELERLHTGPQPGAVTASWPYLDHPDRFVRFAARVALETQPVDRWQSQYFLEKKASKLIPLTLALARSAAPDAGLLSRIITKTKEIDFEGLPSNEKLDLIRAIEVLLCRMGMPNNSDRKVITDLLLPYFPTDNKAMNREIGEILVFLKVPEATGVAIDLLVKATEDKEGLDVVMISEDISSRHEDYGGDVQAVRSNMPPALAISYAQLLSHVEAGWTPEYYETYFQWYYDVMSADGGRSFKSFMENIRLATLSKVPEADRQKYDELSGVFSPLDEMANLPQPEGPGSQYNMYDINRILRGIRSYEGDIERGERMFAAALCGSCHRMKGEGGNSGPDLTQLYTRFDRGEIVNAVLSPNDEISDQYAFTLFTLKDGTKKAGKIFTEDDEKVVILPNPYSSLVKDEINISDISERGLSPVSPMPPGLLNRLNDEEILDLFAYLLSGANPEHVVYGGEEGELD